MVNQRHARNQPPLLTLDEFMEQPAFVEIISQLEDVKALLLKLLAAQSAGSVDACSSGPAIPTTAYQSLQFGGPRKITVDGQEYRI